MKRLLMILGIMLFTMLAKAQFSSANLQATGLTCALCSNAINKALQKVPFIESIKPDIKHSAFNIVFRQNAIIDIDAIKKAVEDAGFSVGGLKLTGNFNGIKIANEEHVQIGDNYFCFLNVSGQTLNGEKTITVVDKNYVTAKEFKKISTTTSMSCLQTGKAGSCCGSGSISSGTRIYHVTM